MMCAEYLTCSWTIRCFSSVHSFSLTDTSGIPLFCLFVVVVVVVGVGVGVGGGGGGGFVVVVELH